MPWTTGTYGEVPKQSWWRELRSRGWWLGHNIAYRAMYRWRNFRDRKTRS
ncbi:hypothetical protein [Nocardia sp. NPDC004722]